ncbi:hypothetical protein SAM40697_6638 [Streptomyces ambofaciens]|uniref:Lipoprotein n=1 Tax=Streptomyces ambofaciens TaxID=1889 RepID=A0ABM6B946_STRAM|nr:DUF6281 family protein [Streptomyces ambofaciens]ANB10591.1 hypothetical protein SAM40697_6638 [Streptomyces ambofaciens]
MRISTSSRPNAAMSTPSRRLPWYAAMVVAALTTACTAQGGGGEAEESCAIVALYGGHTYTQVANVDFTVGEALGPAAFPPCDDTPGHDDDDAGPEPVTAYAVDGLDPRIAIAMRYTPDEIMLLAAQPGGSLPPEVEALLRG